MCLMSADAELRSNDVFLLPVRDSKPDNCSNALFREIVIALSVNCQVYARCA